MFPRRVFFRIFITAVMVFTCISCLSAPDRESIAAEYMILAEGYAGLEKYDQALFFYRKAAMEPSYKNAAEYGIGRIYALTGNWKDAAKVFASLYEMEPENEILISSYAYALAASGDVDKALPVYRVIMEKHPDDARFAVDYVELLFVAGLYDEVRQETAALEERFPDNPEVASLADIERRIDEALKAREEGKEPEAQDKILSPGDTTGETAGGTEGNGTSAVEGDTAG